jgi:type IV pilus assembly protein PilY1
MGTPIGREYLRKITTLLIIFLSIFLVGPSVVSAAVYSVSGGCPVDTPYYSDTIRVSWVDGDTISFEWEFISAEGSTIFNDTGGFRLENYNGGNGIGNPITLCDVVTVGGSGTSGWNTYAGILSGNSSNNLLQIYTTNNQDCFVHPIFRIRKLKIDDKAYIYVNDISVAEGGAMATFTVLLSSEMVTPVTVDYYTSDGSAAAPADYTAIPLTTLTFNSGETSKTISVPITDDSLVENDKNFYINLQNPSANTTIGKAQGECSIINDDAYDVSIDSPSGVAESAGGATVTFTVTLSNVDPVNGVVGPVNVNYGTSDVTANTGIDYTAIPLTLMTFNTGDSATKTFDVTILDDSLFENAETFEVILSGFDGGGATGGPGTGTINDDGDTYNASLEASKSVVENAGTVTFTVTLDQQVPGGATVAYTTVDTGSATAGNDYTTSAGNLTFLATETTKDITIPIINETEVESDETFDVTITAGANHTVSGTPVTCTINDNDYTIEVIAGVNGSVDPPGPSLGVESGIDKTFTITPNEASGYHIIKEVLVDGVAVAGHPAAGQSTYTFANVVADHQISVTFDDYGSSGCDDNATSIALPAEGVTSQTAGNIDPAGDSDYFKVVLPAGGGVITLQTTGSTDTYGYLLDSSCGIIDEDDDIKWNNKNFRIVKELLEGTYYIHIRHFNPNETGAYTLEIEFEPDDHVDDCNENATSISCPVAPETVSTIPGVIKPAGDWDFFKLVLNTATYLKVYTTGNTDTYGYIYDSACTEVANDNDSGDVRNFEIVKDLSAGTYYIAVRHYNATSTGDYVLNVECTTGYEITASAMQGGTMSPLGTIILPAGSDQQFDITPYTSNWVEDVLVDGNSVGAINTYTFSNLQADHTIVAIFGMPPETCMDISDFPLDVRINAAPANIMFVLDDSESMDWEFMTDQPDGMFPAEGTSYQYLYDLEDKTVKGQPYVLSVDKRLYWKSQWAGYNKMYYNPVVAYHPWPTLNEADPDNPRSFPLEPTPTFDLEATYASLTVDAGVAEVVIDDQDSGFSKTFESAIIIDDDDSGFSESGSWTDVGDDPDNEAYNDDYFVTPATGTHTATWTPNLYPGDYVVYARWPANTNNSTAVDYVITYSSGTETATITVDQRQQGGEWIKLGTFDFSGTGENVTLTHTPSASNELAVADAIKFVPVEGWDWATAFGGAYKDNYYWTEKNGVYTATWTPDLLTGSYEVYAMWPAGANHSSSVTYTVNHSGGSDAFFVDQSSGGGTWQHLGTFDFDEGAGNVTLTHTRTTASATDDDRAVADAVKFVLTGATTIDINGAHYYVWSNEENKPYLVVLDGITQTIKYYAVNDDGDDLVESDELWPTISPPADVKSNRTYAEERQNFANWFSFYRKRDLSTRGSVAQVVTRLSGVQIGFRSINGQLIQPVLKVKVGTVDETDILLNRLYSYRLDASRASTPLRRGFEDVGRYFDKTDGSLDGGVGPSPIATAEDGGACQQNFAIIFTDGYYNGGPPVRVANEDGDDGPPYADGGTGNLADVAMYYYERDLDTDLDDMVSINSADDATHQHLVTYGVAFGVHGTLNPDDYDLENCIEGITADCPVWPHPITAHNDKRFKIDDLWHATVNGRGAFVMALNPEELVNAFLLVMQNIESRTDSAASVSINGDELYGRLGENVRMYQSSYSSDGWIGDVKAYRLDQYTGEVIRTSYVFSAAEQLESLDWDDRVIATYDGTAGITFRYSYLTDDQKTRLGSDLVDGSAADQTAENILNFLRGDATNEEPTGSFRNRYKKLGDIVHSSPLFHNGVLYAGGNDGMLHAFSAEDGTELFAYVPNLVFGNLKSLSNADYTHTFFVDLTPTIAEIELSGEKKDILVGGLGKGGKGYYALNVTGIPDVSPIETESDLPARVMWEYPRPGVLAVDRDDLGYTYSHSTIAKSNDTGNAEWIMIFGNGYNSINSQAVLFILNPVNGTLIKKIDTGVAGCNGLSEPIAIDIDNDQKVDYVYAGDLKGNMWKFDLTDSDYNNWGVAYGVDSNSNGLIDAQDGTDEPKPLFQAKGTGGVAFERQPITTKPEVMFHCDKQGYMVIFGTGKYLGETDFDDTRTQTIYGVWDYGDDDDDSEYLGSFDRSSTPQLSNQPDSAFLLQQTLIPGGWATEDGKSIRVLTDNSLVWSTENDPDSTEEAPKLPNPSSEAANHVGWYFDLPDSGERVTSNILIRQGKAIAITFTPEVTPCGTGGASYIMEMDACTGGRLSEPQLDINEDGVIDRNDFINIGTEEDPQWIAPTGIQYEGRLQPPAILQDGSEEIKYFSTNFEQIVTLREKGVHMGVIYWKEIQ